MSIPLDRFSGFNPISVGGGSFPQQQAIIPEVHVDVSPPEQDNTLLIVSGIVVPILIAAVGWWLSHRKRNQ